jgi:hypothetical protein
MPRLLGLSALALATSLVLAGCFVSSPTAPSEPDPGTTKASEPAVAPATGETIMGTGYSFVVPEGWAVPEDVIKPKSVDTLAANLTDADGFADNVNVLQPTAGEFSPEQIESEGVAQLKTAGATDVLAGDRVTIAGSESAHLSAGLTSDHGKYVIEQFYATHAGQTYVVTFSFSPTVSAADRNSLASSVLATWSWL